MVPRIYFFLFFFSCSPVFLSRPFSPRQVPFLKPLSEEQLAQVVDDDAFCQEELHGSNVVLLRQVIKPF